MRFQKGHKGYWLGKHRSEETKEKIRQKNKGKIYSPNTLFKKGHKLFAGSEKGFFKKGYSLTKGKKRPNNSGSNHYNWKGGVTSINEKIRKSLEYKLWRQAVFERDKYTCVLCRQKGGKLVADHIKPFSLFPKLRFILSNGRTLCDRCNRKTDTYCGRIRNYKLL